MRIDIGKQRRWLTAPENNTRFAVSTGYMPVTQEAFESYLPQEIEGLTEQKYVELYKAYQQTQEGYKFYSAPQLDNKAENLSPGEPLILQIRSSCIDPQEQEAYREGVRAHYLVRYISCRKELRRNNLLAALPVLTGLLALFVMNLIDAWTGSVFWAEAVDIVAWVFVWESVDVFVFRNHELRTERLRCLSFMDMQLEFLPLPARQQAR